MEEFITEATEKDNNIGYVPENIETLMADAAFAVLKSVTATNQYLKDENMLAEQYCAQRDAAMRSCGKLKRNLNGNTNEYRQN